LLETVSEIKPIRRKGEPPIFSSKRAELFIRTHNETLSIVPMRIRNPDRPPV
jgi:hypothetical protein